MSPPSFGAMASLAAASWETICRRTVLMATGRASSAEYRRMFSEKAEASQAAGKALTEGKSGDAVIDPYLKAAQANAKRLRSKS